MKNHAMKIDETEYDFEIERILNEIKNCGAKLVGLQFPEGLKKNALAIASEIEENTGAKVIILIDPCYGACDLKEIPGMDLLIHFGHTDFL
jgi:2-(3-amino-3-carboxypropyl)histidine synthase